MALKIWNNGRKRFWLHRPPRKSYKKEIWALKTYINYIENELSNLKKGSKLTVKNVHNLFIKAKEKKLYYKEIADKKAEIKVKIINKDKAN